MILFLRSVAAPDENAWVFIRNLDFERKKEALIQPFSTVGALDGVILPVGPVIVADELPESHPAKSLGLAYGEAYLEQHPDGPVSAFGAALADASALIEAALPSALEAGQPGTPEFRAALRDGIESAENVAGPNGVYTMSPEDHSGHDTNSRVLVQVTDGQFRYLPLN